MIWEQEWCGGVWEWYSNSTGESILNTLKANYLDDVYDDDEYGNFYRVVTQHMRYKGTLTKATSMLKKSELQ